MKKRVHVVAFSGSLRTGSYNSAMIRIAQQVCPENMTIEVFDLAPIPLFNEDLRQAGQPASVSELKERIAKADSLLIAVPEYNYSMSGVLKNAIDWASRPIDTSPLNDKPVAIMGAGGRLGTARAQYHFRQVAVFSNMHVMNRPEVFIAGAQDQFDEKGSPRSPEISERIKSLLIALADWTLRLGGQQGGENS